MLYYKIVFSDHYMSKHDGVFDKKIVKIQLVRYQRKYLSNEHIIKSKCQYNTINISVVSSAVKNRKKKITKSIRNKIRNEKVLII